jgi:hypothetical protein
LTLRSSCPRPRTSTLNSLRSTNSPAGKKKEDDSLVVLQSSKSSKHSTKFQNGEESPSQEGGRPSGDSYPTGWTSVPPRKGNRSPRRLAEKDYHWCVGNNAHKPSGFVMNSKCSGLDDSKKRATLPACLRIKERICDQRRQGVKWSSAMRALSRLPRMKTIDGHAWKQYVC